MELRILGKLLAIATASVAMNPAAAMAEHSKFIAPPMVNIPAGSFMMGSDVGRDDEKPRHSVSLPNFQMGKYLVTVAEFRKFALDTDFKPEANCNDHLNEHWMSGEKGTARWDRNRYLTSDYQPVTCVTWQDANAYAKWLSDKTGAQYRLPTEQEWEYAVKANTTSRYFWGDDPDKTHACLYGNFADRSSEYFASKQYGASYEGFIGHANCDDGEPYNAIVGLYRPNPFGLYDMVGNVAQHLGQCYYPDYHARSKEEMATETCEYTSVRGTIWHFTPVRHTSRGDYKKTWEPGAILGFRLALDGHSDKTDRSTTAFESELNKAQNHRLANRPTLPAAPSGIQLVKVKRNTLELSWQPNDDPLVTGYEIYQSKSPHAHLLFGFYQPYYDKIRTVAATKNSMLVTIPDAGGSFRVVAKTDKTTSLPSVPAVFVEPKTSHIPGRINMLDTSALENVTIRYRAAKDNEPERYYLLKFTGSDQLVSSAKFNIDVKKSSWFNLDYRGKMGKEGDFFTLWNNNRLLAKIHYNPAVIEDSSRRQRVFLEKGTYTLQLSVIRSSPDRWELDWLDFEEVND